MVRSRLIAFALVVVMILAAWGSVVPARAAATFTNDNVRKLVVVGKIRGHLLASIADWDAAQYDQAAEHADEVGQELSSIIAADLKQANLQDDYQVALTGYAALARAAGDKAAVHAAYDKLPVVLEKAAKAFAPTAAFDDPAFRMSVGQGLLDGVIEEYAEGVQDGKLVNAMGYQNAVGFFQIVKEHYTAVQKVIQAQYADMDKAVNDQYAILDKALPAFKAPDTLAAPQDVETAVNAIKAAVSKALNIDLEVHRTNAEVIAATREGLLDALNLYGKEQNDQAYDTASSAYLDNFETLETPLRKLNADLTNQTEKQIVDFGRMIKDGKPIDDLKALYAQIDANLSKAQDLLAASAATQTP